MNFLRNVYKNIRLACFIPNINVELRQKITKLTRIYPFFFTFALNITYINSNQ